jgi:uncharacterized coiled-coil protein SlyX
MSEDGKNSHDRQWAEALGSAMGELCAAKDRIRELESEVRDNLARDGYTISCLEDRIRELEHDVERLRRDIGILVGTLWYTYEPGKGVCAWCDNGDSGRATNDDGHDADCVVSHYYHKITTPFTEYEESLFAQIKDLEDAIKHQKKTLHESTERAVKAEMLAQKYRAALEKIADVEDSVIDETGHRLTCGEIAREALR